MLYPLTSIAETQMSSVGATQKSCWSSKYLRCFLDLLAEDIVCVKSLEAWEVVNNVRGVVTQKTHWVRG